MRDFLGARDYLEGFWERIRVGRFGGRLGAFGFRLQPLAQDHGKRCLGGTFRQAV
jgi:hypothetical protein